MSAAPPAPASRRRHVVVAFTVAAMFLAYTDRVNLAVAVVAMREEFHWSQSVKGLVLAGFFVGYLLFQVASGFLAQRFGGKRVLGAAVLWWSVFVLLTPTAAAVSVAVLIGARVGLGLGEAALLPASYALFSRWIPAPERARSLALFLGGIPLGQIVGLLATAYLTARLGWPASFYLFGALGLLWAAAFRRGVCNDPAADPGVSAAERALLPAAAPGAAAPTPWRALLRSPLVLSFVAAHFCHNWTLYLLVSWLPSYFHEHFGLGLQQSGWYAALPWVANFLALQLGGSVADAAIARGARALGVRRALAATGLGGAALCLLSLPGTSSAEAALALACTTAALTGLACAGFTAVPLDITPRHAPMLIGFSNTLATVPGIVAVALTGWQLDVTHNYSSTFVLSAAVAAAGALLLALTARAPVPEL